MVAAHGDEVGVSCCELAEAPVDLVAVDDGEGGEDSLRPAGVLVCEQDAGFVFVDVEGA